MPDKELIYREDLIAEYDRVHKGPPGGARKLMVDAPAVDAVVLPEGGIDNLSDGYHTFNDREAEIIKILNDVDSGLECLRIRYVSKEDGCREIHEIALDEIRSLINRLVREKKNIEKVNCLLRQRRAQIFEITVAFSRGRKVGIEDFAKYLIENSDNGVVSVSDLPEYVLTFCNEGLQEGQDGE